VKRIIGRRLYKKLKHIRLAFLYTTGFALLWIPYGLLMVRSFTENSRESVVNYNPSRPEKKLQTLIERLFATLHPFLYLYTHHHSRFIIFFRSCKRKMQRQLNNTNNEVGAISTIAMETFEASG